MSHLKPYHVTLTHHAVVVAASAEEAQAEANSHRKMICASEPPAIQTQGEITDVEHLPPGWDSRNLVYSHQYRTLGNAIEHAAQQRG